MEFFRIIKVETNEGQIRNLLCLDNMERISNHLFVIGDQDESKASIGGLWGEFTLTRNGIKGGVRFALEQCPNALAWTATTGYPPAPESIVVHLTINRKEIDLELKEEIEDFLEDHSACLLKLFTNQPLVTSR